MKSCLFSIQWLDSQPLFEKEKRNMQQERESAVALRRSSGTVSGVRNSIFKEQLPLRPDHIMEEWF